METNQASSGQMAGSGTGRPRVEAPLVLGLDEVGRDRLWMVGGKAANLGELLRARLPVPSGFCITSEAFQLSRLEPGGSGGRVPDEVLRAVVSAWRRLGTGQAYAVRSSATVEDGAGGSFAGQFTSRLNVVGEAGLVEAIQACWASAFSDRVRAYAVGAGVRPEAVRMAVVVQVMVPAEVSGVLFTVDPVTGDRSRIVVESVAGLGEGLVSGRVVPEKAVVERKTLAVRERGPERSGGRLSDRQLRQLARLALEAERVLGGSLDIEWALARGRVCLLQARPITGAAAARWWEERQVWTNVNTGEVFPDVVTTMTWSFTEVFAPFLFKSVFRLFGADLSRAPSLGLVAGRVYFNVNTGLAPLRPFPFLLRRVSEGGRVLGGGDAGTYARMIASIPPEDFADLGFRWSRFLLSWPQLLASILRCSPRRGRVWLARMRAKGDAAAQREFAGWTSAALVAEAERMVYEDLKEWDLLYLFTRSGSLGILQVACQDWLDDHNLELTNRLFSALGGIPETEAGLALWRLAVQAHAVASIESALRGGEAWPMVRGQLAQTASGREFLAAWEAFMKAHGHHCRGQIELAAPRWSETPDYVVGLIRTYLDAMGRSDPMAAQLRLAGEREAAVAECRRRLRNPLKRWLFTRALRSVQRLVVDREIWKNEAVRHVAVLRRLLLVLGGNLVREGALRCVEDVFYLRLMELRSVAAGAGTGAVESTVARRREEAGRNRLLRPPLVVKGRFDPTGPPTSPSATPCEQWVGMPVFPGIVTGRARVVLDASDDQQVLAGEILIAPSTDPAWTPYFVMAAGVVMDQGGMLSHGSIIAREYGIPAVTDVRTATRQIRTGDLVRVDGSRGTVTRLEHVS